MLSRVERAIGQGILGLVQKAQRRAVRVQVKHHTDQLGRVTPYLECGTPKEGTLVWLHGFSDEPDNFLRAAGSLARRYRIVMPALPGFADGWRAPAERHTYEAFGSWMSEVVGDIGGERFHLMGNSLGGGTALVIASTLGPERVASLVLVNSGGLDVPGVKCVNDEMRAGQNLFAIRNRADYQRFITRIFARPPFIPRPVLAELAARLTRTADWYERLIADMIDSKTHPVAEGAACVVELATLRVPTLVVWGDLDTLFPTSHGRYLARTIPGATIEVLPGVGHCPHLESPKLLAKTFDRFATSVARRH